QPFHVLVTALSPADAPQRSLKVTASLQDWMGPTFKTLVAGAEGSAEMSWHCVNDGDGSARLALEKDDLLADQLPLALRTWPLEAGLRKEVRLWETIANPHGIEPRVSTAVVTVDGE